MKKQRKNEEPGSLRKKAREGEKEEVRRRGLREQWKGSNEMGRDKGRQAYQNMGESGRVRVQEIEIRHI
jgi:hypothetical protein